MSWAEQFGSLPEETQWWTLLGTRRYMAWVEQGRPPYPQLQEPRKAPMREWEVW